MRTRQELEQELKAQEARLKEILGLASGVTGAIQTLRWCLGKDEQDAVRQGPVEELRSEHEAEQDGQQDQDKPG